MSAGGERSGEDESVRRFACTACGRCCDRGPEMEIGEAAALADRFSLSLIFKVHSLPTSERSPWARRWRGVLGTTLGVRQALDEQRRQLKPFAALRRVDRARDRQIFLTLSAMVDDDGAKSCPALFDGRCSIYERRPLTCRTVPLHYSRAPSTLQAYLDGFTATAGYACETIAAPPILARGQVQVEEVRRAREEALLVASGDSTWKAAMIALMDDAEAAREVGLPTLGDVMTNSDRGYATSVPMLVAWRVALRQGLMARAAFDQACRRQIAVLEVMKTAPAQDAATVERLALYRSALLDRRSTDAGLPQVDSAG